VDTDGIGYEGYLIDVSRTFLCGDGPASEPQRDAYQASYEWIMGALEEQVLVTVEGPRVLVPYPHCTALL